MAREQITHAELLEALRQERCTTLTKVRYAVLENDGAITIGLRSDQGIRMKGMMRKGQRAAR